VALHPPGGGRRTATYSPLLFTVGIPSTSPSSPGPETNCLPPAVSAADWRTTMEMEMEALRTRLAALESALGLTSTP
jgi:hypothetical protein